MERAENPAGGAAPRCSDPAPTPLPDHPRPSRQGPAPRIRKSGPVSSSPKGPAAGFLMCDGTALPHAWQGADRRALPAPLERSARAHIHGTMVRAAHANPAMN